MLVSGQNAVRAFTKSWPIIPTLKDPVRPINQVEALGQWEKDLAIYLDAHPGLLDCGTDPLANGSFEIGGVPPAGWSQLNCSGTQVPGSLSPFAGRITYTTSATGLLYQNILVTGWTYLIDIWARGDGAGASRPNVNDGTFTWTGTNSAIWQRYTGIFVASGTFLYFAGTVLAAGRWVEFDKITITPLNITTWFDRTRRGGRNPTQATASKRPTQTTSAIGSNVTFTGSTVTVPVLRTGAFTYVQPTQDLLSARWTPNATTQTDILDGGAANTHVLWTAIADPTFRGYAGVVLNDGAAVDGTSRVYEAVFNGAASKMRSNDNAYSVGNAGVLNPNGLSIGANGAGLGEPASCTVKSLLSFSVPQSEGASTRISAAMRRRISY